MTDNRSCTCHPDEAPKPCQKRYAFSECQAARIEQLEAENASLASWQCEFTDGKTGLVYGEGGGTYCAMAKEVERLRAALRKIADNKQVRGDCFCGACLQARHARAALEERT